MKLRKVIKLIEFIGESKVPEDIVKHLDKEQYSESKSEFISVGDMDLYHYIRSNKKSERRVWDDLNEQQEKLAKIKDIMEE
jgi:hypothetical protein